MKAKLHRQRPRLTLASVLLSLLIVISFTPFYVMILGSLKPNSAFFRIPPDLKPWNLIIDNYSYILNKTGILSGFLNSIYISVMISLITVAVSACAGYAFAKKRFWGRGVLFVIVMATMILPRQILMVPNFLVAKNLGLVNSLNGVVLTSISAPFGIFLCRQFMQTLPDELTDAATIDGCGSLATFVKIILPLSVPALGALAIFSFIGGWNDFVWQNIMLTAKENRTLPIAIAALAEEKREMVGYQMAGATIATVPMLIIFLFFQKYFIRGITIGAVKG